ncbi:BhlA/UviB family holin-like peptide [Bacillus tropicus]|uniref:BhlA/UviB family holin-like peptide n=2 Tax=Bacillus cereus group TaxID=86661 RepID=UPI003D1A22C3
MEEMIMKYAVNIGVFGVAFFYLLRYFVQRMEKQIEKGEQREEGYREELKRGAEREANYQGVIRENQEIMRKQADSLGSDIKEIKAVLKIKTNEGAEG